LSDARRTNNEPEYFNRHFNTQFTSLHPTLLREKAATAFSVS